MELAVAAVVLDQRAVPVVLPEAVVVVMEQPPLLLERLWLEQVVEAVEEMLVLLLLPEVQVAQAVVAQVAMAFLGN
jgi:hypothetical protein